jgi:hypothetical protein
MPYALQRVITHAHSGNVRRNAGRIPYIRDRNEPNHSPNVLLTYAHGYVYTCAQRSRSRVNGANDTRKETEMRTKTIAVAAPRKKRVYLTAEQAFNKAPARPLRKAIQDGNIPADVLAKWFAEAGRIFQSLNNPPNNGRPPNRGLFLSRR